MILFAKTTRREYTPHGREVHRTADYETTYPVWAASMEAVIEGHSPSMGGSWDDKFQDVLVRVVPMDVEYERARMFSADRSNNRCCDEAVLRNCVCSISFTCATHGTRCVGSHD